MLYVAPTHSYPSLMEFVDGQFSPLQLSHSKSSKEFYHINEDFNTFNYWRQPTVEVDLPIDI